MAGNRDARNLTVGAVERVFRGVRRVEGLPFGGPGIGGPNQWSVLAGIATVDSATTKGSRVDITLQKLSDSAPVSTWASSDFTDTTFTESAMNFFGTVPSGNRVAYINFGFGPVLVAADCTT